MKTLEELTKEYSTLKVNEKMDYDKFYLYSMIAHSTQIEGSTLTEKDTQLLFDEGLTAKGKPFLFHQMNTDLKSAYEFVILHAQKKTAITVSFLQEMSALVMKQTGREYNSLLGEWNEAKGDFRLHAVTAGFGGKSYVDFKKVPAFAQQLCKELNTKINTVSSLQEIYTLSFDAHYNLVTIHPWGDGNGRMGRLLMNYIQFYHKVIPTKIHAQDKAEYINILDKSQRTEEIQPFRDFLFKQHLKTLQEEIRNYKKAQTKDKGFTLLF